MTTYTKKDVLIVFNRYCQAVGLRVARNSQDVGGHAIRDDGNKYCIIQLEANGAEAMPMGMKRRSAEDLVELMQFAVDTHRQVEAQELER